MLLAILSVSWVNECTCREEQEIFEAYKSADAVFVAKVIEEEVVNIEPSTQMPFFQLQVKKYVVVVEQIFKGKLSTDTLFVYTGVNSAECGFDFAVGDRYVIYGDRECYMASGKEARDFPSGRGIYWTSHCTRTRSFDEAEVKELEALK